MTAAALPPVVDADTWQRQLDALRVRAVSLASGNLLVAGWPDDEWRPFRCPECGQPATV